jgi:hypothetical protein
MSDTANNPTVYHYAIDVLDMFSEHRSKHPGTHIAHFLNMVSMGVSKGAQLNTQQTNLVESMISQVVCGDEMKKVINNYASMVQFALQVATFINTAHAANFAKK